MFQEGISQPLWTKDSLLSLCWKEYVIGRWAAGIKPLGKEARSEVRSEPPGEGLELAKARGRRVRMTRELMNESGMPQSF